jgi:hypothetical protein
MSLAIGRLFHPGSGALLGTSFAVTERFALTAFHCIGDRFTGEVDRQRVKILWSHDVTSYATVEDGDLLNDVALLRLERLLPIALAPVRLARDVELHAPFSAPGAPANVPDVFAFTVSGEVTGLDVVLASGAPAIQLTCREAAAGLPLHGLSGAPVLVGQSSRAVGVIRWNSPQDERRELAKGAAVFAARSTEIIDRWPQLDASLGEQLSLLRNLVDRDRPRTETAIRSDLARFILASNLGIYENDIGAKIGDGVYDLRRLDIETGSMIIDVRSDLRQSGIARAAEKQLADHLATLFQCNDRRYIAVLTDGVEWRVYRYVNNKFRQVEDASLHLDSVAPKVSTLRSWLEALLATARHLEPTPTEIASKLGAESPSYLVDFAELSLIYAECREIPTVAIKRAMWAKLLTTAAGANFKDEDSLFVNHTLLVLMAEIIGHIAMGFRPQDPSVSATNIVSGGMFTDAQIAGVIEADFFDWVAYVPGGERFIKDLARRLSRFAWGKVEHDVMKTLYESIIPQGIRHRLGEYYTPDWLAEYLVDDCVSDPLIQTVLDASCGSGTFLFHAVRNYVRSAESAGMSPSEIIRSVCDHVLGFDVHPVAVTLARVTYLLAIGTERLKVDDRPAFAVPVYLGDSLQWGQELTLWSDSDLKVSTALDHESFVSDSNLAGEQEASEQLRFPDSVVGNSMAFDQLVATFADRATNRRRGSSVPKLGAVFKQFDIRDEDDKEILQRTFRIMCKLHDDERNHIWGYYVRNLARPAWLARPGNQVDVIVGNPPWLAYRFMTGAQKASFRAMSVERQLWIGSAVATNQDLSALFVLRCIELYLRPGGRFGYVMPLAAQTRRQYSGFRKGRYAANVGVAFDQPWDLHRIKPSFFPQAVGVVRGNRADGEQSSRPLNQIAEAWSGSFDTKRASRATACQNITRMTGEHLLSSPGSPYAVRFVQGATIVPRFLFFVEDGAAAPLGSGAGRRAIESRRGALEKKPWKALKSLTGTVELEFIQPIVGSDSIMPFRVLERNLGVFPWDGRRLLHGADEQIDLYPGLARWWRSAESAWEQHRTSDSMSLIQRLDYQRGFTRQFPISRHRVVYTKSGMYLAAAIVSDETAVIDHKLYWSEAADLDEARYLVAILNSAALTMAVRPLQGRGEHNPRDFDKYLFKLNIPIYDSRDSAHRELVALAERGADVAASVDLPNLRFEARRRHVREALIDEGVTTTTDALVKALLAR